MEIIKTYIDWCDSNYGACSDLIPGCVVLDSSLSEVKRTWEETVAFHLEGLPADEVPDCLKGEYTFEYELTAKALLHRYDGIISRAAISRLTGIDQKQLAHYMSGFRTPRPARRKQIVEGLHQLGEELLSIQ